MVNQQKDLTVCGEAGEYDQALSGIIRLKPDLALLDITLPGKSGLVLIKKLRSINTKIKLLIVSMHDEALYADRVLRAGGDGYIMKQEDPEEIILAIRDVLAGHIYISEKTWSGGPKAKLSRSTTPIGRAIEQLTDAEVEILESLGRGKGNQELSRQLALPVGEVTTQVTQIRKKLNLKSVNALIRCAVCWVEGETV